jgi:transposase
MADPLTISLTPEQRSELEAMRDHHPLPYMRERATAILKIAEGQSGRQVAQTGLLKRRHKTTVYEWVERYEAEGIDGLTLRPGRGRKPSFSPYAPRRK